MHTYVHTHVHGPYLQYTGTVGAIHTQYTHAYIYIYIYIHTRSILAQHRHGRCHTHTIYTRIYIYIYIYIYTYIHYIHTRSILAQHRHGRCHTHTIYTRIYIYIYTYIYIYMHTYIQTYMHDTGTVGATAANKESSRSHLVFTLTIEIVEGTLGGKRSQFHLVDLAGSERQKLSRVSLGICM